MRTWTCIAAALCLTAVALSPAPTTGLSQSPIVDVPVTFRTTNVNDSAAPCLSDGKPYTVEGHIVAPERALAARAPAATLYMHGGTSGEFQWHAPELRSIGYDNPWEMAKLGHISVTFGLPSYDSETIPAGDGKPNGWDVCLGSAATTIHQIVQHLRAGTYLVQGREPVAFKRIALAGQSAGAAIVHAEAWSFRDVDAIIVIDFADQTTSGTFPSRLPAVGVTCATGGEPSEDDGSGPRGYAYVWPDNSAQTRDTFFDVDPRVVAYFAARRNRDFCGGVVGLAQAAGMDQVMLPTIRVPVLVIMGDHDKLLPPPAGQIQLLRYIGSSDRSLAMIRGAGHTPWLERPAPAFRAALHAWLAGRGF